MTLPHLLVVLHETKLNEEQILTYHQDPEFYASYHTFINRQGEIVYLVPPNSKAYGAANSRFINSVGEEEQVNGSVDDFAYHIALESTPAFVSKEVGFTRQQYKSLAWLLKATGVAIDRITTHGAIQEPKTDEPRCLNMQYLMELYFIQTNTKSLSFGVVKTND